MASTLRTARSVSRSKAEDVGVESTLVGEEDFDGDGAGDDVSVGDDVAVGVDNDAGAEALAAGEGGTGGAFVGPVGCDLDFDDARAVRARISLLKVVREDLVGGDWATRRTGRRVKRIWRVMHQRYSLMQGGGNSLSRGERNGWMGGW